jgi:predicted O-methyltransferase YrrM
MWNQADLNGFINSSIQNIGQINLTNEFGKKLSHIAKNTDYNTFLEIGTWNGLGSTVCIYEGLKNRSDNWTFFSLETNIDKLSFAKNFHKNNKIIFSNNTILSKIPSYDEIISILDKNIVKEWYDNDYHNIKNAEYFFNNYNVDQFDVVLLDGGEYYTYFEYLAIKDNTKILCLDDINTIKCSKIYNELINDDNWYILDENKQERNGWAIFNKK